MKKNRPEFILLTLMLLIACNSKDEYFSIKGSNYIVPIEINDNLNSEVLVIHIGYEVAISGPGSILHELKKTHTVLYYPFDIVLDCEKSNCTLNEFSQDLDVLVRVIFEKYSKQIFLYGDGLGANLALLYADIGIHKDKVKGIILSGATSNLKVAAKASILKLIDLLENERPLPNAFQLYRRLQRLSELNAIDSNLVTPKDYYDELLGNENTFTNPFNWSHLNMDCDYNHIFRALDIEKIGYYDFDLTNYISNIFTPVNILWAKDEFLIPLSVGEQVFDLLPTQEKEFHIYENLCLPFSEDEEDIKEYTKLIIDFIEKYK